MTNLVNKEVVLKGFNGGSDDTDNLVIWVVGDESEIIRITTALGDKISNVGDLDIGSEPVTLEEGKSMGFDFDLPKHEDEFIQKVNKLLSDYAKVPRVKYRIYDIDYDEGHGGLPNELIIELRKSLDSEEVDEEASEFISDKTGFCHNGFKLEQIK